MHEELLESASPDRLRFGRLADMAKPVATEAGLAALQTMEAEVVERGLAAARQQLKEHPQRSLALGAAGLPIGAAEMLGRQIKRARRAAENGNRISRDGEPQHFGAGGQEIVITVLGDSTGSNECGEPDAGVAEIVGRVVAEHFGVAVRLHNYSVSGARTQQVTIDQVPRARERQPDVAVLCLGANDVSGFVPSRSLDRQTRTLSARLREGRPDLTIVHSGAPPLDTVPLFSQPLKWFAGTQSRRVNGVIERVCAEEQIKYANLVGHLYEVFKNDPACFSPVDDFHPAAYGYALLGEYMARATVEALEERGWQPAKT